MKKLIITYLFIFSGLWVLAQPNQMPCFTSDHFTRFRNLSILQGLSNNNVLDIIQDDNGYIWIATADGLNRYDGYKFKVFKHDSKDSLSISNNYITSLSIDKNKNLWIGTKNGLNRYNSENENFYHFPLHSIEEKGLSHHYVKKVYSSNKDQLLWVETTDGVLNKINLQTGSINYFRHKKVATEYYDYHSIFEDNRGDIWVGGRFIGPYVFDTSTNVFELIIADSKNKLKKRDNDIACIFQNSKNEYWMSATDGFYQYFREKDEFKKWLGTSTFDIIESQDSTLWLATGGGLYNFNPATKNFRVLKHNQNNSNSIADNHLNCLLLDANDNLWIGTSKGISVLNARENVFRRYKHIPEISKTLNSNKVSSFLQDSDGDVWIGTMGGGISNWNTKTDEFKNFSDKMISNKVSCLFEDSDNNIWIGLWSGKGFYRFNKQKNEFKHFVYNPKTLKYDWYSDFFEDNNGRLWIGFWGAAGIHFFNREKEKFEPFVLNLLEAHLHKPLKIIEVDREYIWSCNFNKNIHRFNSKTRQYELFVNINSNQIFPEYRSQNRVNITNFKKFTQIYCTTKSNNGTIFFATDNGVIIYNNGQFNHVLSPQLNFIQAMFANKNILYAINKSELIVYNLNSEKITNSISFDKIDINDKAVFNKIFFDNNLIWLGTNKGLYVYNIKLDLVLYQPDIKLSKSINDIKKDEKGNLWIATESGLLSMNQEFEVMTNVNMKNSFFNGLLSDNIYSIIPLKNYIWLGTGKGLIRYNTADSSFYQISNLIDIPIYQIKTEDDKSLWLATELGLVQYVIEADSTIMHYKKSEHMLTSRLTQFISQDKSGNIWVGTTNNGLNKIDTTNFNITHFINKPDSINDFWGDHASCMYECEDGTLLFGGDGINIYQKETNNFKHFTKKDGLISNKILGITQDNSGLIWVSTPKGLVRWNQENNITELFAEDWGLLPHEFNRALTKIKSNEILVASDIGFYTFYPNDINLVKSSENIEITSFKVFDNIVKSDFTERKNVILNYDENFFTFEFSDFNFTNTKTQYLYMLEGIDKNWVNSDKVNFASYTNIAPGKYSFLVTTHQNLKKHIKPEKIIVTITPPFWKKTWFVGIEILLIALIFVFIWYQRTKSLKLRVKHLQLEQKLLRSQMNPHFVFNALIAIQSFIFKNNPKEAGRYLSKFAKLMRLFLQNTRSEYIPLSQELETLVYYMELQKLRFSNSFDFTINCIDDIDPELIKIPPMMAQPFIENCIEHGFKSIDYQGKIEINYEFIDNTILISIKDNGKGINRAIKESDEKNHTSLATKITHERLKIFSNKSTNYVLQVNDLSDLDANLSGTEVVLNVPYKKED